MNVTTTARCILSELLTYVNPVLICKYILGISFISRLVCEVKEEATVPSIYYKLS